MYYVFDSDAYGVDTDSPVAVSDWFSPNKEKREESQQLYNEAMFETLMEIADFNKIPFDVYKEWNKDDWDDFKECLDL